MKNILIVGATSAIAQEISKIYATENARVVLWGRNRESLETIASDLNVRGAVVTLVIAQDINELSSHGKIIEEVFDANKVDIVVLAHGILGKQLLAETDQRELMSILNTNFVSHASILNILAQKMIEQKTGTIAVLSSVAGDRGRQSNYIYGSANAGKTVFVNGLRNRLFPLGIHVVNIKLGFVDTPMTKDFKKSLLWSDPAAVAKTIVKAIKMKKNSLYAPFFWYWIMLIIKFIPEAIFKRMKL